MNLAATLLAVPNLSEGRDREVLERIEQRLARHASSTCTWTPTTTASVFTLAGNQGEIAPTLLACAEAAIETSTSASHEGLHPHVGALDVAPVVYLDEADRGAACAEALTAAALIGATPACRCSSTASWPRGPSMRERAGSAPRRPRRACRADGRAASWCPTTARARRTRRPAWSS